MDAENDDFFCSCCNENIDVNEKHASFQGMMWHNACFICVNCNEGLEDVLFNFNDQNELLCFKCYDDKFGLPCSTCQDVIKLGEEKFRLGELIWHRKCFQCQNCRNSLKMNSFWLHDNLSYCKTCYGDLFTEICEKCQEKIWKNGLKFRDLNMHANCFVCSSCDIKLSEKKFIYKDELVFCEKCYSEKYCKICVNCQEPITGFDGGEMITSNNENWHNKCFYCTSCEESLVGLSFVSKDGKIFCPGCAK